MGDPRGMQGEQGWGTPEECRGNAMHTHVQIREQEMNKECGDVQGPKRAEGSTVKQWQHVVMWWWW